MQSSFRPLASAKSCVNYGYRGVVETIPLIPPKPDLASPANPKTGGCTSGSAFSAGSCRKRNLLYLLEAFDHLVGSRTGSPPVLVSWELHLFGEGPARQALASAVASRGLERAGFTFMHGST